MYHYVVSQKVCNIEKVSITLNKNSKSIDLQPNVLYNNEGKIIVLDVMYYFQGVEYTVK